MLYSNTKSSVLHKLPQRSITKIVLYSISLDYVRYQGILKKQLLKKPLSIHREKVFNLVLHSNVQLYPQLPGRRDVDDKNHSNKS